MLGAVGPSSDPYGGLNGYKYVEGVPSSSNGRGWINPSKADAVPGGTIPAPRITSTPAHPGRKSNNTIPYTRVCSKDASRISGKPGMVTFVHSHQSAYAGCGTDRSALMCGLDTLNFRLSEHRMGQTTLPLASDPRKDWREVEELNKWRLDGIVLGNPDTDNTNPTFDRVMDMEPTETVAMNICVQGTCSALNVFLPSTSMEVQLTALDEVFIGLFFAEDAAKGYYTYRYEPLSVKSLWYPEFGHYDLTRLVGVWKLGKVMDTKAAVGGWPNADKKEHRVTLNVNVEWIPVISDWEYEEDGFLYLQPTIESLYLNMTTLKIPIAPPPAKASMPPLGGPPTPSPPATPEPASPVSPPSPASPASPVLPPPSAGPSSAPPAPKPPLPTGRYSAFLKGISDAGLSFKTVSQAVNAVRTTLGDPIRSQQALETNRSVLEEANQVLTILSIQQPGVYRAAIANAPEVNDEVRDWVLLHQDIKRALARGRTV